MTHDQARAQFRNAMASLGAPVNVITTDGPHGRCGITASAVCSVTDTPPTMLVCINQSSYVHDVLLSNGRACINVLGAHAQELARVFAGMAGCSMDERFARCGSRPGALQLPVLDDAIASLEGCIVDSKKVGSHSVLFVQVEHIGLREDGDGLVYFGRQFHRLARASAPCEAA
ncbi:flavin reductase [Burkholderia pseudomultivorans]|uniref:Flavin reductase like domain protein n=1 Tax=Burkholderia cenocepacia TaxID=95486 RepID=A0AAN0RV73_9BURK|nr:flavin reductase [Burkholderia pseudomultivorans]AIO34523.1 flavin reductase like domain protein [Burkholderia cenocepacia]AOI89544.1 FMN reductase [Burkholderia pseudomultivorans]KVC41141.1 FMN reductase [Burkholderia pseudomultivorans]KWI52050.1 FMN reductase [Burkholderia pseudomultivorans]MBF5008482.1 flavin reductase [Burkholderia pseudomultivorans]